MTREMIAKHAEVLHQALTEKLGAYVGALPCAVPIRIYILEAAVLNLLADLTIESVPVTITDQASLTSFSEGLGMRFCQLKNGLDQLIGDKLQEIVDAFVDDEEANLTPQGVRPRLSGEGPGKEEVTH